ncbi:DUF1479-domain-containing protein [Piedraia hortae CBS 480.64]|uniref:DUF1479-domain-containing protein n=1 Tax=Piedraia hortae CBS 480.64 TaxID=1314780 RepID=A0A6A7BXW5_9PEZI|nr:DUF1479-domain-containing protein [Piedraia hortae CBS 480.64]
MSSLKSLLSLHRIPHHLRNLSTAHTEKKSGDISNAFASLSGLEFKPLDPRFADIKTSLLSGHEEAITSSWARLLNALEEEIPLITSLGSNSIPTIDYPSITNPSETFRSELRKRGVAVIRNVIPEGEALSLKRELKDYIAANPHTRAFPPENPQVYELYWSTAQTKARAHPRLLAAQKFLMSVWNSRSKSTVSTAHPTMYADRLRMRLPGDSRFALGPHVDGGSCERWEKRGYGLGGVYDAIFSGRWEEYDPWEASCRVPVVSDLYSGVGACSMFRMFQGWLALSEVGPFEGTLLVNPLLRHATAYFLLRPFFEPIRADPAGDGFLKPANWRLERETSAWLQGATPGHGQELRDALHPHLKVDLPVLGWEGKSSMVHVLRVRPGDYVAWHCDTIHAVDGVHAGKADSSVMYIPTCPLTVQNAAFLKRQREAFLSGRPCPDFGGGVGESGHVGHATVDDVEMMNPEEGMRAFGLKAWNVNEKGLSSAQRELLTRANEVLGF